MYIFVNKPCHYVLCRNFCTAGAMNSTLAFLQINQGTLKLFKYFSLCRRIQNNSYETSSDLLKLRCVNNDTQRQKVQSLNDFWVRRSQLQYKYDLIQPGNISPSRPLPKSIPVPEYAYSGVSSNSISEIEIKNAQQIELLKISCKFASKILSDIKENVQVFKNGYHGDCAATYGVGNIDNDGQKLIEIAKTCLNEAIKICYPGQRFSEIGETISDIADTSGFSVVPAFCGHGIGTYFHGPPQILHYRNNMNEVMKPGMTFTIEPVICEGKPDIVILEDGWTAMTVDNSRCAQFEHTVLITECGVEILTS